MNTIDQRETVVSVRAACMERVGQGGTDCVVLPIAKVVAGDSMCPDHLVHLQEQPADPDDAVAVLRWSLAWNLDFHTVDHIADATNIPGRRIMAFMEADHAHAGELLTFTEAARLIRHVESRLEDRELRDEADDYRAIAQPYIEAAGLDHDLALQRARDTRESFRATHPLACRLTDE